MKKTISVFIIIAALVACNDGNGVTSNKISVVHDTVWIAKRLNVSDKADNFTPDAEWPE